LKARREAILIGGLLVVLLVITGAAAFFQASQQAIPPLSSNSNAPDGARALHLWLAAEGYRVNNQPGDRFAIPVDTREVLVLEPLLFDSITGADWKTLDDWVSQGGTLLLASRSPGIALYGNPFKVGSSVAAPQEYSVLPPAPFFDSPPLLQPVKLTVNSVLETKAEDSLVLLSIPEGPVALQLAHAKGQVLIFADPSFLSNSGLKDPGAAQLALNLFSRLPPGSLIYFDEWHHGERSANAKGYGPMAWLTQTSAGFAVLFSAAIVFLSLVLAGRPFGKPVPLPSEQARRGPLEFVIALANLNRRAGHRQSVISYYHGAIKRAFGKRYRLDPALDDRDFVAQLTRFNPGLDGDSLLGLLDRLSAGGYTETQIVQLAREASDWLAKVEH
jgi:hypothetical protein